MSDPRGVLLTLAYDGTGFSGWAQQRNQRTVEHELHRAIAAIDPNASPPRGCSRTDAGVHAEGQLAAFDATITRPARGWVKLLNNVLPEDISVRCAREVNVGYNPRFTSRQKRYRYWVLADKVPDALLRHRAWRVGYSLDMDRLVRESKSILGTHDFAAFRAVGDERAHTIRTITNVTVDPVDSTRRLWVFRIEGNSFLYNMVRILVGTLIDVARNNLPEGTIARALRDKDRSIAGQTAPAHGLTLEHIDVGLQPGEGSPWPE